MPAAWRRRAALAVWTLPWLLWGPVAAGEASAERRRRLEVSVLESIDLGDVMVEGRERMDIEMAADGRRTSPSGASIFGSLPSGSGRLRLVGEPGACVRLSAHPFGRRADRGLVQVHRVLLRSAGGRGQEEIDLRLDAHGVAVVEVGVRLRLSAVRQSARLRLALSFEARYGEDCLH